MDQKSSAIGTVSESLNVIGMNGATLVACGTNLPVVQCTNGDFCRFVIDKVTSRLWHNQATLADYVSEGRISVFETPIPLPASSLANEQLLVLYVNSEFLDEAEIQKPSEFQGTPVHWTKITDEKKSTWGTPLPESLAKRMLDEWAKKLCQKIDRHMKENDASAAKLQKWSDFGLCAATDKGIRWSLYLRYGAVIDPERVRRLFDVFVQRQFPKCTWDQYLQKMREIQAIIQAQPLIRNPPQPVAKSVFNRDWIKNITKERVQESVFAW
jgi:hypothetical protein